MSIDLNRRYSATNNESPIAASAAANPITNTANTCPVAPSGDANFPNATAFTLTLFKIISIEIKMPITDRR